MIKNIFISSTNADLKLYRNEIKALIHELGHNPLLIEDVTLESSPPIEKCYELINEADIFLGIYAHRYGTILAGENTSYIELEYDYASKLEKNYQGKKIEVLCLNLSGAIENWPKKGIEKENNQDKLDKFLAKIKNDVFVKPYNNEKELYLEIAKKVGKLNKAISELEEWQNMASKKGDKEINAALRSLLEIYSDQKISDKVLIQSIDLIVFRFKTHLQPLPTESFTRLVGNLVKGVSNKDYFVASIKAIVPPPSWYHGLFRAKLFHVTLGFLLGLLLMLISYNQNIGGFRSTFLPLQNTPKVDVMNWLIKHVKRDIALDDFSKPETQQALFALGLAYDLDKDSDQIKAVIESQIDFLDKMNSLESVTMPILQENLLIMNKICSIIHYQNACKKQSSSKTG